MQRLIIAAICCAFTTPLFSQDTLHKMGHQQLVVAHLKETADAYLFTYKTADGKMVKTQLLKILVDSIIYAKPLTKQAKKVKNAAKDSSGLAPVITQKLKKSKKPQPSAHDSAALTEPKEKRWKATLAFGLNIGNVLEFNPPSGTDKKHFR